MAENPESEPQSSPDFAAFIVTLVVAAATAGLAALSARSEPSDQRLASILSFFVAPVIMISFALFLISMTKNVRERRSVWIMLFAFVHLASIVVLYAVNYRWFGLKDTVDSNHVLTFGDAVYFSLVTLTTVGYGDIVPLPYSRGFAAAEALTGYVLLTVLITIFSSMLRRDPPA